MKRLLLAITAVFSLTTLTSSAQEIYNNKRASWLTIAKKTEPALVSVTRRPSNIVTIIKDGQSFQGYKIGASIRTDSFYLKSMKSQSGIILDFGEHLTGFVTFKIEDLKAVADAALRLKFTFA